MYGGIVLCSGVDSYINSERFDADACQEVMRLNAISQIQLVSRIFQSDSFSVSTPFRAAIASSSILSEPVSDGLAYGMSKSALETGFRFLAEEKTSGSFSVSAVRLPYVGEPMGTIIGPRPEERPLPEEGVISPEEAANALCHAVTHSSNAEPWSVVEVN
jgi:NAD(P)-dependent dehydrogenase (short-subunit alcohol dehydrogenase family)